MRKTIILLISAFLLASCAPQYAKKESYFGGYSGDSAIIVDTSERQSISKAFMYAVEEVNGQEVENTITATRGATYGQGSNLITRGFQREVPANEVTLKLVARVVYAAPVQAMFGDDFSIEKTITFSPKPKQNYLVKGFLSEEYTALWLEDSMGNKQTELYEEYEAGVDVEQYRKQLAPSQKAAISSTDSDEELSKQEKFLNLSEGESASLIKGKLGEPDSVKETAYSFWSRRKPYTTYFYGSLGELQLIKGAGGSLYLYRVIPSLDKGSFSPAEVEKLLSVKNGRTIRDIAEKLYNQVDELSQESLDLVADKVWEERNTEKSYMADGAAWLCKVLAKSQNSRYKSFLKEVSVTAATSKLKGHAENSFELLVEDNSQQYTPPS
ncbi:hypothetical protein [Kangiella marina]|uniref:Lipoprotein n=1 Tax=Kangiella marina TaxID=1079178 RepID=A0ABP8INC1_9GAMM